MTHHSKIVLTILKNQVLSYLPKDKPAQPDAGKQAFLRSDAKKLIGKYNYVIDELCRSDEWIENRAHLNNRFKVYDGRYQLTASCAYLFESSPKAFTLELVLDEKTYEPTNLKIAVSHPALTKLSNGAPFSVHIPLQLLEGNPPSKVVEAVESLISTTLKQVDTLITCELSPNIHRRVDMRGFSSDIELVKDKALAPFAVGAREAEIIGVSLDADSPVIYVGYKTDEGTGVTEVLAIT